MKRKILSWLFIFLILPFSLLMTACGKDNNSTGNGGSNSGNGENNPQPENPPSQTEILPEVNAVKDLLVLSSINYKAAYGIDGGGVSVFLPDGKTIFIPLLYKKQAELNMELNDYIHEFREHVYYHGVDNSGFSQSLGCDYLIIPSSNDRITSPVYEEIFQGIDLYFDYNIESLIDNKYVTEKVFIPNVTYTNDVLNSTDVDLSILTEEVLSGTSGFVVDSLHMIKTLYGMERFGVEYERMTNQTTISNRFKCNGQVYEYTIKFDIPGLLKSGEVESEEQLMPFISYECNQKSALLFAPITQESVETYSAVIGDQKKYDYANLVCAEFSPEDIRDFGAVVTDFCIDISKYTIDPEKSWKGEIHTVLLLNSVNGNYDISDGDRSTHFLYNFNGVAAYSVETELFADFNSINMAEATKTLISVPYFGIESDGTCHSGRITNFNSNYRN